jgi:hypothetical protein
VFAKQAIIPAVWSLIIAVLCGLPGNTFPNMSLWALLQFDSFAHAAVFTIFVFLWSIAFYKQRNFPALYRVGSWLAVVIGIAYGALIEIMQYAIFVGRDAEWGDMLADSIGCVAAYFIFKAVYGPVLRHSAHNHIQQH